MHRSTFLVVMLVAALGAACSSTEPEEGAESSAEGASALRRVTKVNVTTARTGVGDGEREVVPLTLPSAQDVVLTKSGVAISFTFAGKAIRAGNRRAEPACAALYSIEGPSLTELKAAIRTAVGASASFRTAIDQSNVISAVACADAADVTSIQVMLDASVPAVRSASSDLAQRLELGTTGRARLVLHFEAHP